MRPLACLITLLTLAPAAHASPWTLPAGRLAFTGRYSFESAEKEFLDDSDAQVFPLRGQYRASTYTAGLRFGITDRFELSFEAPVRQVTYTSDPVILLPGGEGDGVFDYYQENVIDLSQSKTGLGDLKFTARFQLLRGPMVMALELGLKTPTGYDPPQGTFGDRPTSRAMFLADAPRFVRPENVSDDVTLGDGQLDVTPALLLGWSDGGTFARLDAGYSLRMGDAGDHLVGGLKLGQSVGRRLVFYTGVDAEYAVTEGEVIGISVSATDPSLPASEYGGTTNLELREITLDRDRVSWPFGAILRVNRMVELNAAYQRTLWGRNTALIQGFSVGVGLSSQLLDGPEASRPARR